MKQGEIWELYLNPVKGSEQSGRRAAVIISGNLMNQHLKVIIVCPLTTKIKNYKGDVVLTPDAENGLSEASEILTFHIKSVSKERLQYKIGDIKPSELKDIIQNLGDILRY